MKKPKRVVLGVGFLLSAREQRSGVHHLEFVVKEDLWKSAIFHGLSHGGKVRIVAEVLE